MDSEEIQAQQPHGQISLKTAALMASIGIHPWEKLVKQPLWIEVDAKLPIVAFAQSQLDPRFNYVTLLSHLKAHLAEQHFDLIEQVAESVANTFHNTFAFPWIRVRISKPWPTPDLKVAVITLEKTY